MLENWHSLSSLPGAEKEAIEIAKILNTRLRMNCLL
ncbi:hypothetical protein CAL7102_07303 [Dulcicalothrix desertica PCC 7102]|nr:hypothetical protein CAL7102_07303 [Dulcicalothrix desertica PCC 7102]